MNRISTFLLLVILSSSTYANWPQWRGPDSNAVAPEGSYPVEFSPAQNMLWEVDLEGEGSSTPVVWGNSIYLTLTAGEQDVVLAFDADGKEKWRRELGKARVGKHANATGSNPSPVTDGKHVIAYFKSGLVACLNTAGEEQWRVNLQDEYGEDTLWWDLGTSPVLTSAGVCIAVMQLGDSYLVTLDVEDGSVVWKEKRQYECPEESDQSYTTPAVVEIEGVETIVTFGADHLTGHNAKTGELLWEFKGFNPEEKAYWRVIASATIAQNIAVVPYGRAEYVAAVRLGEGSSSGSEDRLWKRGGFGSDVPSPVISEGKIYLLGDKGEIHCLALESGKTLWKKRLPRSNSKYYASPLLADGKLYCLRDDGMLYVAQVEGDYQLLAKNDLGDRAVATPVPLDNTLLVRTRTKLYRFGDFNVKLNEFLDVDAGPLDIDFPTELSVEVETAEPRDPLENYYLDLIVY